MAKKDKNQIFAGPIAMRIMSEMTHEKVFFELAKSIAKSLESEKRRYHKRSYGPTSIQFFKGKMPWIKEDVDAVLSYNFHDRKIEGMFVGKTFRIKENQLVVKDLPVVYLEKAKAKDHKDYYDGPEYKGREVENVTISYKTMTARFNFEEATFVNITPK